MTDREIIGKVYERVRKPNSYTWALVWREFYFYRVLVRYTRWLERPKPKPDESRLLSKEEIENIRENVALSYIGTKAKNAKVGDFECEVDGSIVQLQDANTASILEPQVRADERTRIMGILKKEYPAITSWKCWEDLEKGVKL